MKHRGLSAAHWILVVGCLLLAIGAFEYVRFATKPEPTVAPSPYDIKLIQGQKVDDFELADASGRRHRLSDLAKAQTALAFVDESPGSKQLLRYMAEMCGKLGSRAPRVVTVASFPPSRETQFRRDTGLAQTVLYESPDGPVTQRFKASPAPRVFHLEKGLTVRGVGPSPAESSIYDLGVSAATGFGFTSPYDKNSRNPAPMPDELDRTDPKKAGTAVAGAGTR